MCEIWCSAECVDGKQKVNIKGEVWGETFFCPFLLLFQVGKKWSRCFFNPKEHKCVFWPQPTQKITLGAMVYKQIRLFPSL